MHVIKSTTNDYPLHILKALKKEFHQCLIDEFNRGKILSWGELSEKVLKKTGIEFIPRSWECDLYEKFQNIVNQNFLSEYFALPNLREIIVHNEKHIQVETSNVTEEIINNISNEELQLSLEVMCLQNEVSWNHSEPFASFLYQNNQEMFRVSLIHYSTSSTKSSKAFFRKINDETFPLTSFGIKNEIEIILRDFVLKKKNIVICGSTGSGKTSFIKSLINEIPQSEHVIVLEDTHEITPSSANMTNLLSKEDLAKKTLKDYCSYAMRMRPDRLILGEIRGGEIVPFILAMNTGHRGLLSSIHADSAKDALTRMATLFSLYGQNGQINYSLVLDLICSNLDHVVFVKDRKLVEIIDVLGSDNGNIFFETIYSN